MFCAISYPYQGSSSDELLKIQTTLAKAKDDFACASADHQRVVNELTEKVKQLESEKVKERKERGKQKVEEK